MRYAVKLLSSSDLTLFEAYFRKNPGSKQKGVNLNNDVLGTIFPGLPTAIGDYEYPVALDIYGPSGAPVHHERRKIVKTVAAKNWRLNGKLVYAPGSQPARYDDLLPGDIAVLGLDGGAVPTSISMVLLSAASTVDTPFVTHLQGSLGLAPGAKSMTEVSVAALAGIPAIDTHPLRLLLPDQTRAADLVAAGEDDDDANRRLEQRARTGNGRPISPAELAAAKARAQEIGRTGEALFCSRLERQVEAGSIHSFVWTADESATSPYDFEITELGGSKVLVDVKSTTRGFAGNIHISAAELDAAAGTAAYRIARVFDLEAGGGPQVCMSDPIAGEAATIIAALTTLPGGVRASKLEVSTDLLKWGEVEPLPYDED